MKLKISKTRFNEILKEEVSKHKKISNLESDKKKIEETLLKLESANSQEEIDEIWGGVKNLFNKGAKSVATGVKNTVKGMGQDVADAWNDASQTVNKGMNSIKKTYQQGEEKAAKQKAQAQITQVWNQIKTTQKQLANLNNQYLNMTGKPFNHKAVAGPAKSVQNTQPVQQTQQRKAAE